MSSQARWIKSKAKGSLNPVQVETTLSEIASGWDGSLPDFLRDFPLGEEALIHLLAISQICAERLQRDPGLLRWLARPEISMSDRGPRRMLAELHGSSESIAAENFRSLRLWKAREMTRIALREVAEASALEDTTAELSCLAGVCLATVYEECDTRLRSRAGAPGTEFTILGMGKLGGRELNHSSDIDLIFLYGEEGQGRFTNHEWHNRLAEQIVKSFSAGGIREIEFVVQTLQFIHGAKHAFLQEQGTLKALRAIAQLELLPSSEVRALDESYRFLRRIEHRLQIEAERQTHSIPEDPEKRERLARSLGFDSAATLLADLQASNERVREIFHHLIASGTAAPAVNLDIFSDPARATRTLNELAQGSVSFHVAPRTRQIFRRLRPLLLEELVQCADPDATLIAIVRFVEAFGLRSLLFELLATNPKLLELLVRTFDASFFATNVLIRHPHLLEEITRSATLNRSLSFAEHAASLHPFVESGELDSIRGYRQTQLLRTIMRDVLGLCPLPNLSHEVTAVAGACLLAAAAIVGAKNLTIIAMGKFVRVVL